MESFFEALRADVDAYLPSYGDWWGVHDLAFFYLVTFLGQTLSLREFNTKADQCATGLSKMLDTRYPHAEVRDLRDDLGSNIKVWCLRNESAWFDRRYAYSDVDIAYHFSTAHEDPARRAFLAGVGITEHSSLYDNKDPSRNANMEAHTRAETVEGFPEDPGPA